MAEKYTLETTETYNRFTLTKGELIHCLQARVGFPKGTDISFNFDPEDFSNLGDNHPAVQITWIDKDKKEPNTKEFKL